MPIADSPGPEILATRSVFYPDTEEVMGWDISENGFRIVLSKEVPLMVHKHLAGDIDEFLADHGMTPRAISAVGSCIPAGPAILEATETALGLHDGELEASWDCLRQDGQSVVGFRPDGAGRGDVEAAPGARDHEPAGGHGAWLLLGASSAAVVA